MEEKIVKTVCGICAPGLCGMLVHVKDGKMVKVKGDLTALLTEGLCVLGVLLLWSWYTIQTA